MTTPAELPRQLQTLACGQGVTVGVGDVNHRGWFCAQVISHDAAAGRLVLTCFMDRLGDRPLEPGESVIVSATRMDDPQAAPMSVEHCSSGTAPTLALRMAGAWQHEDDRRNRVRVRLEIRATRARRWVGGAWRDLDASITDLSSRGIGLSLDREVRVGDRLSVAAPLGDGGADLRATIEVRYVHPQPHAVAGRPAVPAHQWHAGGPFRNLSAAEHERVVRFLFAELRALSALRA